MSDKKRKQQRTPDPLTIDFSGPRIAMRKPDSAHILSFRQEGYYTSATITTAEIYELVNKALDWLGPELAADLLRNRGVGPWPSAS